MKKIITCSLTLLFIFSLSFKLYAQCLTCDDPEYSNKKAQFWKEYLVYKNNIDNNIVAIKPIDPSGLFYIDENNHFNVKAPEYTFTSPIKWFGERDAVSSYIFSQSTGTYASINTTGTLDTSGCDDGYNKKPIGFTFNFNGTNYDTVTITCNGWIMMGQGAPSGYSPICTGSYPNVIVPFARDLRGGPGASDNGIYFQTTGSAPNRIFTVEWYHWGIYSLGNNEIDFQVKLYETSNKIEFIYKPETPSSSLTDVQVGLMGTTNADFYTRTQTTGWLNTSAGVACSYNTFNSGNYPPAGLTFTWLPPPSGIMGYYSSAATQIAPGVPIPPGTINAQIIKVAVTDTGISSPISISNFKFQTTGSNNPPADIVNAKLYYTGSTNTFSTTTQYGSTISNPNGVFYITGSQNLIANATNYFWLTYDINASANTGDSVDAQCDSITGTNAMGTVAPNPSAPFGSNPIDPYCLGQVSNPGCPYGLYISNVTMGTINNTTGCNGNLPYCYTNYTNLSTQIRINNPYQITISNQLNPNVTAYGVYIDWNNNNSFADGGEYFPTTIIPANSTVPATVSITVPAGATLGNHRMRIRTNLSSPPGAANYCATLGYGEQEDYKLVVIADTNMTYSSGTTDQTNVSPIYAPYTNAQIIGIQVNTFGSISPLNATSFTLNTNGSTNPSTDISRAKLWYTGASPVYAATTLYGTYVSPNSTFTITGTQQLVPGTNYFWLTYDIPSSAVTNNVVDAECNSILVGGISRIPTIQAPVGNRTIAGTSMSGIYTIPGSYVNFNTAITDLNNRGISGPVTFNVAAGFIDTAANLVISTTGTASNPIVFRNASPEPRANPIIVAGVGTGTTDGIIKINGGDYITFDGIDLQENPANTTTAAQMEWGYALVKPDGTNGCQNVTIKNCAVTLNKTNTSSTGIYSNNHSAISTATFVVSVTAGANSNNTFLNNTITNCYNGIWINGYADASPYTLYDQNNTINGCTISNYGGSTTTAYGIYGSFQNLYTVTGCNINSAGGTNSTGILAGIYGATMTNSNIDITNNTISLTNAGTATTVYCIYNSGSTATNNNVNILNNTIQNCNLTAATSSSFYGIYNGMPAYNLTESGNRIIGYNYGTPGVSTGTVVYSIYNISAIINSITITNNLDSGNTINGTSAYTNYRIYNGVSTLNCTITGNRIRNNILCGTTAASTVYGIYNSSGTFTCNMSNNIVSDNNLPTTSSHSMYFLYNLSSAPAQDYNNNTVSGNTSSGSGTLYGVYYSASPGLNSTVNINNNSVTNLSKTTATGAGGIYGIYQASTPQGTLNINNNTVTGFTSAAATLFAGIYQGSSPPNYVNINNNRVGNFTNAGVSTIYGILSSATSSTQLNISGDSVYNITSAGSTLYGIYLSSSGLNWNVYKNSVSGLTSNTGTTATAHGIYDAVSLAGSTLNIYNNMISDINTPASTSIAPALSGIYVASGSSTTTVNLLYNTILLNSTSSGTTFGTAGIYALTTPVVTLKNNVIVNKSTPGGSGGQTVAYRRSSITLTTYGSGSNNNCFYAGGPAANRLIYYDGTNSDQTIAAYKSRVNPRDNASVTENPPFVNGSAPPYDLRIQTAVPTQLESGGQIISSPVNIIDDKFAVARYPNAGYPIGGFTPTAPDMGANEFGGLNADTAAPFISYAPLGNGGTTNRTFNNVIITDANGVNIAPGTKPRCYYKRSLDSNVVNDTTNITDGWKFVEATGTTSPFTFIIDYSKLVGGTGVTAGQVVQYFVIAQDLSTLSNVGYNQAVFTTPPSTVNVVSSNAPITGTLSYNIVTNIFSGSYNVGTSQTYTSLTGAGGLFASINAGVVSGDITALITSDLVEDGTNALNLFNETGAGGYRLRIIPSDATLKTISGAVAQGMIRFNGSRRVTIDGGSFFADQTHRINLSGNLDAPGKYLTFRNTNGSNPTFTFINDAVGDSIKYCNIESNNISTATTTAGTILFSTTTGTQGNDSNVIAFCDIRDRSDATGTPAFGIYNNGSTTTPQQYNSYNVVTNCNVYNYFYDAAVFTGGIWLNSGTTDWVITGNSFYQTVPRTLTLGATFASIYNNISTLNNNNQITNNYIGGNAPQCGGSPMTYTGAATYSVFGIQAFVSTQVPTNITGNTIRNINLTSSAASSTAALFKGIYAQTGWINVSNNTVGADTGTGSITITINNNISSINPVAMIHCASLGNITNNKVGSITIGGNATSTADLYAGIYMTSSFAGQTYNISNNLIGSLTTPNSIQVTNLVNGHQLRGIYNVTGSAGSTINVSNNTIANLTSFQTSAVNTASVFGIQNNGGTGNYNFANNTVRNLTSNTNANANATLLLNGLFNSGSGINTYSQNSIYTIYGNGTTGMFLMNGIFASGTVGGTISRNKIFDLRLNETGTVGTIVPLEGLNLQSTGAYTVSNNMISITNGDATDYILKMQPNSDARLKIPNEEPSKVVGIIRENELTSIEAAEKEKLVQHQNADFTNDLRENVTPKTKEKPTGKIEGDNSTVNIPIAGILQQSTSPSPNNYYYNTVYVGGNQPGGSYNSYAFQRQNGGNTVLRNNLLINARTGGGGNHYVIGNENTNPLAGWPATASNYNALLGSNASTICEWGVGNSQTIQQWVTSSSGDKQSWSTTTATILPSNLLTNIATCDLTVQSANAAAWLVSGKGIALSSVNIDFTGDSRVTAISGGCTDIGADEFTATPPSNPVATQTGTPGPGATTTYSLYGRTILSIDWGVGGISYPTLMSVTYYSGINPTPAITSPNRNSNSYWTVVPIGSLTGTTYNATLFFGDNETYNITSPSTNTLLAKYTNTFWQVFPAGSGFDQFSIVDWGNLAVTTGGLSTFSTFALSDAALPSIILATPANNSTSSTLTPTFTWNRSAGSTTHRIQVATDSLFGTIVRDTVTADTSKVFAAFTNNTSYWWRAYGTNSIGTGAWSQIFKFRVVSGPPPPAIVNLKVIPGGFYNTSTGTLNMRDTIRALLIDSTGCLRSDSTKAVLDSVTFTANISFANASTGNYYLYVFHRNHVFISARYEQSIIRGSTVSYDFTTDSSKTYGNNVIKVATSPVLWGMIPGEANQDGYVDGLDQTLWIFDNGLEGYRSTDFNGDLYVDGLDQTIWILMNGLNYSVPCELTFENVTEHTRKVQMINNREIERIYTPKQNK